MATIKRKSHLAVTAKSASNGTNPSNGTKPSAKNYTYRTISPSPYRTTPEVFEVANFSPCLSAYLDVRLQDRAIGARVVS